MKFPKLSKIQKFAAYVAAFVTIAGGFAYGVDALGTNRPALLSESLAGDDAILKRLEGVEKKVDDNSVPRLLKVYNYYKRNVKKLSKKQETTPLTPDEAYELDYDTIQMGKILIELIEAGHNPERKKNN